MTRALTRSGTPTTTNAARARGVVQGPPTFISVNVASGTEAGGTSLTITGTNLLGATSVTVGGAAATLGANSATTQAITTPSNQLSALSSTGANNARDIVITTPYGSVTATGAFTYTSEMKRIFTTRWKVELRANDPDIVLSSGKVSTWPDFNAQCSPTQGTAGKRPTYNATGWNSGPSVTFVAASLTVLIANLTAAITTGKRPYVFCVFARSSGTSGIMWSLTNAGDTADYITGFFSSSVWKLDTLRADGAQTVSSGVSVDTSKHVYEGGFTAGGTATLVIDGTATDSVRTGAVAVSETQIALGTATNLSSVPFDGKIMAFCVLDDAPSAGELTAARAFYASANWLGGYAGNAL